MPRREILKSDFERALATSYGHARGQTLLTQYRMLAPIGRVVSRTFYYGKLEHGRDKLEIDPSALPAELDKALVWITTDSLDDRAFAKREETGTSLINLVEADAILSLMKRWSANPAFSAWLTGQIKHAQGIGVICTYAAQRDLIRKRLQTSNIPEAFRKSVKIDTVDSYQGKENPVVVLSLVRTTLRVCRSGERPRSGRAF